MRSRFKRMHEQCDVVCDVEILEDVLANTLPEDIEALIAQIVLEGSRYVIDASFPELMAVNQMVTGHKSRAAYQFIVLDGVDGLVYIVLAIDLSKTDAIKSLDDFAPEQLAALSIAAGQTAA